MSTSLTQLSATQLASQIRAGEISSTAVTQAFLERCERFNPDLNAMLRFDAPAALEQAAAVDAKRKRGEELGLLAGVPVAIKDLVAMRGERLTCGSRMLENFRSPYDAGIIERLRAADAVFLGRTNMDEFAMGGTNENSAFGPVRNPWNSECTPGGSSGGAAAVVAADMAPLSIGSDTGGSIRQPAGWCGITGLKPTYGRVSRYGLVAFASSLDQLGPMARSAADTALLLEAIAGHDPRDSTSVNTAVPSYTADLDQPLHGLRLGVVKEHFARGLDPQVEAAVREALGVYESLGATLHDVELPHAKYGIATYYIIAPCEASGNLARYDGIHYGYRANEKELIQKLDAERAALTKAGDKNGAAALDNTLVRLYRQSRSEGFGPEVKRRIMLGTYALSAGYYDAYYVKALQVRRLIRQDYDRAFEGVDLIIGPVAATPALALGQNAHDPLASYLVDLYTVSANLAGIAGISLPCGFNTSGLPIGLQLQSPPFQEDRLRRAAHQYQTPTTWHTARPVLE